MVEHIGGLDYQSLYNNLPDSQAFWGWFKILYTVAH